MKLKEYLIVSGFVFLGTGLLNAQEKLTVSVKPDKILYAPGETAQFKVTVCNEMKESVNGVLEVKVIWEMDDSVKVYETAINLSSGEKRVISAAWKTVNVLGCEVRVNLRNDKEILATAAEYFNVCKTRDVQRVGIHVGYPNAFTYPDKSYLDTIPGIVSNMCLAYANLMEHFSWAPDSYADLTPDSDEWTSTYFQSKTAILKAIEEEHKHGMKSYTYVISLGSGRPGLQLMQHHPEWFFYRENGQLYLSELDVKALDYSRNPDRRAPFLQNTVFITPNFAIPGPLEYGVRQIIDSTRMFNWDGVRFDGHFVMWNTELFPGGPVICPNARDNTGKVVVSGEKARAIIRANTDYTRKTISAVFPDFLFMFNSYIQECDITDICRNGGASANEPIRESYALNSRWNTWKDFTQYLLDDVDTARKNGGYAYALLNTPWTVCPNADRIQYAILFATGDHPWFACPWCDRKSDMGGSHYPIQKDYFRFATRFSAALWGPGIERVKSPEDVVDVCTPQGSVWWKNFVQRRPMDNGRQQLVVHLINQPPTLRIESESQALPAPVKDIMVKFKQPVTRVWLATSQPEMSYRMLPVENGIVKVPELNIWSMVIAETNGK